MHPWSYQGAVIARYFDTHSKALGNEFRDYIFENQLEVNLQNLRSFAEKPGSTNPTPPTVGLIVDATDPAWSSVIKYTMPDNDIAEIDTTSLTVS